MKKHSQILIIILTIMALVFPMTPIKGQGIKANSARRKADAITDVLTSYANYHGWEVKAKVTKQTQKQVTKKLQIETDKTYFSFKQLTKKSGKKYVTSFISDGEKFQLKDVERSISSCSSSRTVKSFLKKRSEKTANRLTSYGKKLGWNTEATTTVTKNRSVSGIIFRNGIYRFMVQIKVIRSKKEGIRENLTLQKTTSTETKVKEWLERYKNPVTTVITPEPIPSPTVVVEQTAGPTATPNDELKATVSPHPTSNPELVTIYANDLIAIGKEHKWEADVTWGEAGTSISFSNAKWKFDVVVYAVEDKIFYKLMGVESDRETVIKWLNDYKDSPPAENSPVVSPVPQGTETPENSLNDSPTTEQPTIEPTAGPDGDSSEATSSPKPDSDSDSSPTATPTPTTVPSEPTTAIGGGGNADGSGAGAARP